VKRVVRALEVWILTGRPLTEHFADFFTVRAGQSLEILLIPRIKFYVHGSVRR